MKELPFPEGVKPLDIFVSSVNKRRLTEEFEGRSGTLNYGYDYGERSVDLSLWLEAHDTIDYRLIRNELYAFFDTHDVFYIEETRAPSRVLKVAIDESYIPERINQTHSSVEISCRTLDSVFWESKYTTVELHDTGYSATAEKYGLVDNINIEKLEYKFTMNDIFNPNLIPLRQTSWEPGSLYLSNGENSPNTDFLRLKKSGSINITPGETYTINDNSTYVSRIIRIGVFQYKDGVYTGVNDQFFMERGQRRTFTAVGDELRISLAPLDGSFLPPFFIEHEDERIKLKLEKGDTFTGFKTPEQSFNIYNAGNVKIEPESMMLNIIFNNLNGSKLTLKNKSTDEEFIFENSMPTGTQLRIEGMVVRQNLINRFRDTNKKFISLAPGENQIEISGVTFDDVRFEFKYLYK